MATPLNSQANASPLSDTGPFALANVLLRQRHLVVRVMLGCLVVVSSVLLLSRRQYRVDVSFIAQSRSATSGLSLVATQVLNLSTIDASRSPAFYVDLLKSRQLLESIARAVFDTVAGRPRPVVRVLVPTETDSLRAMEAAVEELAKVVQAVQASRTGVVTVTVRAKTARMAHRLAEEAIHEVNRFNVESRKGYAAAEREFTSQRLELAGRELRAAEDSLVAFYSRNRDVATSPSVKLGAERLARSVTLRLQVYSGLLQSFEQARIEEVRETPVISVIDGPLLPQRPEPRGLLRAGIATVVIGLMLGVLVGFVVEWGSAAEEGSPDAHAAFQAMWAEMRREARDPRLLLKRILGRPPAATQ